MAAPYNNRPPIAPPPCPQCGNKSGIQQIGLTFKCPRCRALYDNDPDEGGTFSDRNPSARLDRQDRERQRKLDRLGRR